MVTFTKPNDNDPNRTAQDKMTADYNRAKTEYLMGNMEYRKPTQEEVDSGYYNPDAKVGITDFNDPVYDEKMKNFSFKVGDKEWAPDSSPMPKKTDKDIVPRSKAFVPDMIPQTELLKMDLDDLEDHREAIFNNEYDDAKADNNTSRIKLLEGRIAKLDKLIDEKRSNK